jgi:hypothetical protein
MIRPLAPVRDKPNQRPATDTTITLSFNDGTCYRPSLRDRRWVRTQVSKPVIPEAPPPCPVGPFPPLPPALF